MPKPLDFTEGRRLDSIIEFENGAGFGRANYISAGVAALIKFLDFGWNLKTQAITMGGVDHTLVTFATASTAQTRIDGAILLVNPGGAGTSLTLPAPAYHGTLKVRNVGANTFTLKNSAGGSLGTIGAGMAADVYSSGTVTYANFGALVSTSFSMADDTTSAALFYEGANNYLSFNTNNAAENMTFGAPVVFNTLVGPTTSALAFGAGWAALIDASAPTTGQADVILRANVASAWAFRVAAVDLLTLVTTTGLLEATLAGALNVDYTVATAKNLADFNATIGSAADTISVVSATTTHSAVARTGAAITNAYSATLDSDAADDSTVFYNAFKAATDGTDGYHSVLSVGAGFDALADLSACASGEADFIVKANVASAIAVEVGVHGTVTPMWTLVTTTGAWEETLAAGFDQDYTLAAAGTISDMAGIINHASDNLTVLNVHGTPAIDRTGGTIVGVKVDMNGRAGDNGATYYAEQYTITDGGGTSTTVAHKYGDNWDYIADYSSNSTAKTNFLLSNNKADAYTLIEGSDVYLRVNTTAKAVGFPQIVTTLDGVSSGTTRRIGGMAYRRISDSAPLVGVNGGGADAETAIDTYTVPANTIKQSTVLRFSGTARITVGATAGTLRLRVRLGATTGAGTVVAIQPAADPGAANNIINFEGIIVGTTAPGGGGGVSVLHRGKMTAALVPDAAETTYASSAVANQVTNGALLLEVTGVWDSATNDAVVIQNFEVEAIG